MSAKDAAGKIGLATAKVGLLAALIGLVSSIVGLGGSSSTTHVDPNRDLARTHFQIKLDKFTLDGDVVVKGDGRVGSSGHVNPKATAKAEKCRFVFKFEPKNKDGDAVGEVQFRQCDTDGPEQDHPAFGPVWLDNPQDIAYVKITAYLDGHEVSAKYCHLMDDVCTSSP